MILRCFFVFIIAQNIVSAHLPELIDLRYLNPSCLYKGREGLWKTANTAFNGAPEVTATILYLKDKFQIDTLIETGTCNGNTTILFSYLFDQVHTIELDPNNYKVAKDLLSSRDNVECHLGGSDRIFPTILPSLKDKFIMFYLDAHWGSDWPLLRELEVISKTHKDRCVIIIDDAKVPDHPKIGYCKYGEKECSFDYISGIIGEVYLS